MSDVLARIIAGKREEVARAQQARPWGLVERAASEATPPRGFIAALERAAQSGRFGLIAEIKKASPSAGLIRPDFDPPVLARAYAQGGATCLSVLTDGPDFQGEAAHLIAARNACTLPVLRKDFIVDRLQVWESAAHNADAILLIAAILEESELRSLREMAHSLGLAALVEVHDADELAKAVDSGAEIIGVNNRNLDTFEVSLDTSLRLSYLMPAHVTRVSESGIFNRAHIEQLSAAGFHGFLIGESLMKAADPTAALQALLHPGHG
jgi:indole-3-glycerol phosphate synthase